METTQEILTSSPNSVEKKNLKNNGTWWEKTPSQKFIHYKEAWACSTFFQDKEQLEKNKLRICKNLMKNHPYFCKYALFRFERYCLS